MDTHEAVWKFKKELHSGTTSLAVMGILVQSREPMYGYEIGIRLGEIGNEGLPMNQGALYPVLRSLEKQGLLNSQVEPSLTGPPRKYYKPTEAGKAAFVEWQEIWARTRDWLELVVEQKHVRRNKHAARRT
ncbi:MAG: PadR family transcriptional regulator [Pirellula sp.]